MCWQACYCIAIAYSHAADDDVGGLNNLASLVHPCPWSPQLAIRVMVESFISTQKYSLQRELQRSLRRFIVLPSDYYAVGAAGLCGWGSRAEHFK